MILVDLVVPSVNNVYDFQMDEKTPVGVLIEEISELIEQKEQCRIVGERGELMLCSVKDKSVLSTECTLRECGIQTGDSLLLV